MPFDFDVPYNEITLMSYTPNGFTLIVTSVLYVLDTPTTQPVPSFISTVYLAPTCTSLHLRCNFALSTLLLSVYCCNVAFKSTTSFASSPCAV